MKNRTENEVNITNLDRIDVFRVLYNQAKVQGPGILAVEDGDMSREEAELEFKQYDDPERGIYFDYHKGRVMKVQLDTDAMEFCPRLYDRDNGKGAAQRAVDTLS